MLGEAADRLREALRLQPSSARAKWNLELAERRQPPPPSGGGGPKPPPPRQRATFTGAKPAGAAEPGTESEPGGADSEFDGATGAADPGRAAAPASGRRLRRSEGLVIALVLALLQVQGPELHVSVEPDRVSVGEEVVYTVRAVSHSSDPMDLSITPINGFEIISRSERTEVSFSGGPTRTTVLEMHLRALSARPLASRARAGGAGSPGCRGGCDRSRCGVQSCGRSLSLEPTAQEPARTSAATAPGEGRGGAARVGRYGECGRADRRGNRRVVPPRPPAPAPPPPDAAAAGDRWRVELPAGGAGGDCGHAQHGGQRLRSLRGASGRLSSGARHDRDSQRHAEVQYAASASVLQPGRTLCSDQPA